MIVASSLLASTTTMAQSPSANNAPDEQVWITIGKDAVEKLNLTPHSSISLSPMQSSFSFNEQTVIAQVPASQIDNLSEFMHEELNRCGGFFFHESLEDAQNHSQVTPQLNAQLAVNYTINNAASVNALISEVSSSNMTSTVNSLSAYHNRYYTQQSGVDAANWVKNKWTNMSSARSDISVATYNHSWQQPSVIATIQGTGSSNEVIVLGGHLDSINQSNPSGGKAPGADDNASGIAVLTETLSAIVASGFKPEKTIKLMGYAAEEVGLRGSKAIAQNYKSNSENVIGVAQFDMSAYKGSPDLDIVFISDYTNSAQNQFMKDLAAQYLPNLSVGDSQCGYACSDHASWNNEGFAASFAAEARFNDSNSNIHTVNDTSFDANHSVKFAKLAVAYAAELAKGSTDGTTPPPPPPPTGNVLENGVAKTGLNASTGSDLNYTMEVPSGATGISFDMGGGTGDADLYLKFGSAPTDSSYDCRPYKSGNTESCNGTSTGGTYYVRVKAYSTFSGLSLTGNYTDGGTPPPPPPGNDPINESVSNITVNQGQWTRYTQELAAGYATMTVSITGGTGDADLYVRHGAQSTSSAYDCRPYKNGNVETCTFNAPAAGTWYIDLYGYNAASGVTLTITANP